MMYWQQQHEFVINFFENDNVLSFSPVILSFSQVQMAVLYQPDLLWLLSYCPNCFAEFIAWVSIWVANRMLPVICTLHSHIFQSSRCQSLLTPHCKNVLSLSFFLRLLGATFLQVLLVMMVSFLVLGWLSLTVRHSYHFPRMLAHLKKKFRYHSLLLSFNLNGSLSCCNTIHTSWLGVA